MFRKLTPLFCVLALLVAAGPARGFSFLTWDRHPLKKDPDQVTATHNTWSYDSGLAPSGTARADVERELKAAMATWNNVANSRWQFDDQTIANGNGVAHTSSDANHDLYWYHEVGTLLAVTSVPVTKSYQPGGQDVRFNNFYNWSFAGSPSFGRYDFQSVALHELGHVMGSHHAQFGSSVMYGVTNSEAVKRSLTSDDRVIAEHLYSTKLMLDPVLPESMIPGEDYDLQFVASLNGGALEPAETEVHVEVSFIGNAEISLLPSNPDWNSVTSILPGLGIHDYSDTIIQSSHYNVHAIATGVDSSGPRVLTIRVRPVSGTLEVRYRANYIDPSPTHWGANGNQHPWKAFGDLVPRSTSEPNVINDQQGYPARRTFIPSVAAALPAPSSLQANPLSTTQIALSWTDNSTNETGFTIERKLGEDGSWSVLTTVPANTIFFHDNGSDTCTRNYYRVKAFHSGGNSGYSNQADAATGGCPPPPEAPSDLVAVAPDNQSVDLSWTDNSQIEGGFTVQRTPTGQSVWQVVATLGPNTTTFQDSGLISCGSFSYRVRAFNTIGNSTYSNVADTMTSGTVEIACDGIDQDCSGADLTPDADGDGVDMCDVTDVNNPDGRVADCDDSDPGSYPGAPEVCDGMDNDCDSNIDEDPDWLALSPPDAPSSRSLHRMTYDVSRGATVLFGGFDVFAGSLNDLWEWDGNTWTEANPATSPPGRDTHALVYDDNRGVVVLFGGRSVFGKANDTWEWDGTNWTDVSPAVSPPAVDGPAAAFDGTRGRMVIFGGVSGFNLAPNDDLWEFDGANWTELTPAIRPQARKYHAMAYDAARNRVVLFGGENTSGSALNDTWIWDGTSWANVSSPIGPFPRRDHALIYDSTREVVILFGGKTASGNRLDDTWEWDGATWTNVTPPATPGEREQMGFAYDAGRRISVMFGGKDGGTLDDTWEYGAAVPETCNGVDDDCDGTIDEDCFDDGDGVDPPLDNCPEIFNPEQSDIDGDGAGDLCDACPTDPADDSDGDGLCADADNCPLVANDQADLDADGIGDACDLDRDGDGVDDDADCAPLSSGLAGVPGPVGDALLMDNNESYTTLGWRRGVQGHTSNVYRGTFGENQAWSYDDGCMFAEYAETFVIDGDVPPVGSGYYYVVSARNGCGESRIGMDSSGIQRFAAQSCGAMGGETDGDGVPDLEDNCALDSNPLLSDFDLDFVGDACDNCMDVSNPTQNDADFDDIGDACDSCTDTDGDGLGNPGFSENLCAEDDCPDDPLNDTDADSICGDSDNCPNTSNPGQENADGDTWGDACDPCIDDRLNDRDADGLCANEDNCPLIGNPGQEDTDGDGVGDACED